MLGVKKGNRITLISVVTMLIFGVIVVRLFQLQIIEHEKWLSRAENEAMKQLTIPAKRGEIYAYDGKVLVPLVLNESVWLVFLDPVAVVDGEKVKQTLEGAIKPKITADIDAVLTERDSGARYRVVARGLNYDEANKIKEADLAGVGMTKSTQRTYPNGDLAAQTLGFVNADGVGQYGVEGYWEETLHGKDGTLKTVTDVNNIPLTIGGNSIKNPAEDGRNLVLSLDVNVQAMTEKALRDQAATIGGDVHAEAVVIDPRSGRILAMAAVPNFDPSEYWNETDANVYNNPVTTNAYEPGSVIKSFTTSAGVDTGTIKMSDTYYNSNSIQVGDVTISNLDKAHAGTIDFQTALGWSLNTGMVEILRRMGGSGAIGDLAGRTKLYDYFHERFGFGYGWTVGVATSEGMIYRPDGEYGNAVQYANMTFGQGMSATMLQVAGSFGGIVGDGTLRKPWLVEGYYDGDEVEDKNDVDTRDAVTAETAKTMRGALIEARKLFKGTIDGWTLGGKTGTSETLKDGKYTGETTEGSYLGFGVKDGEEQPSFVVMTHFRKEGEYIEGGTVPKLTFDAIAQFLGGYLR